MVNRNRTQRKNKNKNKNKSRSRSRMNRKHRGGAASMSCNEASAIMANPGNYGMVKQMAARVQSKSCETGGTNAIAPNKRWYNARAREGEQGAWRGKNSPTGMNVVPVKSCGPAGLGPDGTCAIPSQAKHFNYVA